VSTPEPADELKTIADTALFIREETIRLTSIAKTGHYASTFSCAEILAVLYDAILRLRHGQPSWPDRDRLLLGKGHAAVGVYPLLVRNGFFDRSILDEYTRLGNPLGDHPDMRRVPGIDFSSGSLGHALSAGLGMALAARMQKRQNNVFVLLGDGEQHEGQVWEAAMCAAHYRARNLIAIVDRNKFSLDGEVEDVIGLEPLAAKWEAFGWRVEEVDGHDAAALLRTVRGVVADDARPGPAVVIAHTVKGKGISYMESETGWHLGWLQEDDEREAYEELRRNHARGL
jgi:transketolase